MEEETKRGKKLQINQKKETTRAGISVYMRIQLDSSQILDRF
jgi:hypothetical protein